MSPQDEASCRLRLLGLSVLANYSWPRHADGEVGRIRALSMDRECHSRAGSGLGGSRSAIR